MAQGTLYGLYCVCRVLSYPRVRKGFYPAAGEQLR
jgi:hypothetical protein